jgi:hypothetical protein
MRREIPAQAYEPVTKRFKREVLALAPKVHQLGTIATEKTRTDDLISKGISMEEAISFTRRYKSVDTLDAYLRLNPSEHEQIFKTNEDASYMILAGCREGKYEYYKKEMKDSVAELFKRLPRQKERISNVNSWENSPETDERNQELHMIGLGFFTKVDTLVDDRVTGTYLFNFC